MSPYKFIFIVLLSILSVGCTELETASTETRSENQIRSIEEATEIAMESMKLFYGDTIESRLNTSITLSTDTPVQIIRGTHSRSNCSDTLIYIINFADDMGFAVVSANKSFPGLMGISNSGNCTLSDIPENCGINLWLDLAKTYVSTPLNDDPPTIIGGFGELDSLNTIVQNKEWEEKTINYQIGPLVHNSWGQGSLNHWDIEEYPEGFLFDNGLCGCGALAIAEICLYYQSPKSFTLPNTSEEVVLNWDGIKRHNEWIYRMNEYKYVENSYQCKHEPDASIHTQVAKLCKYIGILTKSRCTTTGTSTYSFDYYPALDSLLTNVQIQDDAPFSQLYHITDNEIFLMTGHNIYKDSGHAWICDGYRRNLVIHYLATRYTNNEDWKIVSTTYSYEHFNHFNWGWNGKYNGWFNTDVISLTSSTGYENLHYLTIKSTS